jgi:hypothetical protein
MIDGKTNLKYASPARRPGGNPNVPEGKSGAFFTCDVETWPSATFRENRKDPRWDVQVARSRD